ncbi:MAG: spondin domain-containing protein, partial [Aquimonas sp.]
FAPLAQSETYILTVENLAPAEGVHLTPVWVGFHAGDFALFEIDGTASTGLERVAEDGAVMPLDTLLRAGDAGRTSVTVANPEGFAGAPVFEPGSRSESRIELDPARHRFLSYASMVIPSNDAFVGNPGARSIRVFGDDGQPAGPVSFLVYGDRVWDAGTEANSETDAAFLNQTAPNTGTMESGRVQPHPGFNGSSLNPNATPSNILGGSFMGIRFDPVAADFTRPAYPLLRVTLAPAEQRLRVRVRNVQPAGGVFFTPFWVGLHDGSFDLYDRGAPASPALERLAEDGSVAPLAASFAGAGSDAVVAHAPGFAGAPVFEDGASAEAELRVDPSRERWFSYASMVIPSNDAFVANGEPRQFEVFSEDGRFHPLHVRVTGGMVLDAGTEANTETDAAFLNQSAPDAGTIEALGVRLHPGFNGSAGNPQGSPRLILGSTNAAGASIDAQRADFTRGNPNLIEITVSRWVDASFSGAWYDPARSGEGYLLDIADDGHGGLLGSIAGYTYAADGSGEQVWFSGAGPIVDGTLAASVVRTSGGRYLSTENRRSVQREVFGTVSLRFDACGEASLQVNARDPAYSTGQAIALRRITAGGAGTLSACGQ